MEYTRGYAVFAIAETSALGVLDVLCDGVFAVDRFYTVEWYHDDFRAGIVLDDPSPDMYVIMSTVRCDQREDDISDMVGGNAVFLLEEGLAVIMRYDYDVLDLVIGMLFGCERDFYADCAVIGDLVAICRDDDGYCRVVLYFALARIRCLFRFRYAFCDLLDDPVIEGRMTIMGTLDVRLIDLSERSFQRYDQRCFLCEGNAL